MSKGLVLRSATHEKVMQLIAEYGYITSNEVAFLNENPHRLLHYMKTKKIIETFPTHLNPTLAYTLTPQSKRIISSAGLVDSINSFTPGRYKETMFYHGTALIQLQLIFEQILGPRLKKYISGVRLQKNLKNKKVCDAEIIYSKDGKDKTMAVELELSRKWKERFLKLVRNLAEQAKEKYNTVIIIYSMPSIKENWQKALKDLNTHGVPYFFIQFSDFVQNKQNCKAQDINDKAIPLF